MIAVYFCVLLARQILFVEKGKSAPLSYNFPPHRNLFSAPLYCHSAPLCIALTTQVNQKYQQSVKMSLKKFISSSLKSGSFLPFDGRTGGGV